MFYSRRRKFSVYRDLIDNDLLLSDSTYEPNSTRVFIQEDSKDELSNNDDGADDNGASLFSLHDITSTVNHLGMKQMQSKIIQRRGETKRSLKRPNDSNINKSSVSKLNKLSSDGSYSNPNHSEISSNAAENAKLLADATRSSLHISEFEQPPQSTSTPFNSGDERPLSMSSLLSTRPSGYLNPVFHFAPKKAPASSGSTTSNSSFQSILTERQVPITYRTGSELDSIKSEINTIIDKMRSSVSIDQSSSNKKRKKDDHITSSLPSESSSLSMVSPSEYASKITPTKSIMKHTNSKSRDAMRGSYKKVRIDETPSFSPLTLKKLKIKKRKNTPDSRGTMKKKIKLHHKVDSNATYSDFKILCDGKDPLRSLLD